MRSLSSPRPRSAMDVQNPAWGHPGSWPRSSASPGQPPRNQAGRELFRHKPGPPKTPQGPPLLSEAPQGPGGASTHGEHCPDPTDQSPGHTPSVSITFGFCPQRWSCDCTGVKCTGVSVWLPRFKSHHHLTATSPFSKPQFPPLLAGDNSGERVQTVDLLSILGT